MANWCYTVYAFTGEEKALNDFSNKLAKIYKDNTCKVNNGWDGHWLGNVLINFGIDYEKVKCRGCFDVVNEPGNEQFFVSTDTAWYPLEEVWDAIIEKHYTEADGRKLINYVYRAEEAGMGLAVNTDRHKTIFRETHLICTDDDEIYAESEEEVVDIINVEFKADFDDYEEAVECAENNDWYILKFKHNRFCK